MSNKKIKVLGLVAATVLILFVTAIIGYVAGVQTAVHYSKKTGFAIDYLPEKITKLETDFMSKTGLHFRGKSGKLYRCDYAEKTCEAISPEPEKYTDKKPFTEAKEILPRFAPPPKDHKQIVTNRSRGLVGHQTAVQYALLEDGTVWKWAYSGNETGDSFPFWHLENIAFLLAGVFGGLIVGSIISIIIWFGFYPRK